MLLCELIFNKLVYINKDKYPSYHKGVWVITMDVEPTLSDIVQPLVPSANTPFNMKIWASRLHIFIMRHNMCKAVKPVH